MKRHRFLALGSPARSEPDAPGVAPHDTVKKRKRSAHEPLEPALQAHIGSLGLSGVEEYVAVLVETGEVRWHRLAAGNFELLPAAPDGTLRSVVFPGLWLDPSALLAEDVVKVWSTLQQGLLTQEHADFVALLASRRS